MTVRVPQTVEELSEPLVRCHDLWRRSPGGGQSPWAKDGPWHLAQGEVGDVKGDWSTTLLVNEAGRELEVRKVDARAPRAALDRAEVAERDRVTAWLELVADARGCQLAELDGHKGWLALIEAQRGADAIWWATRTLWRGESRIPWSKLARDLGWDGKPDGLKRAVRRGMALLVCRLNGWPTRRARLLLGREEGLAAVPVRAAMVVVVGEDG